MFSKLEEIVGGDYIISDPGKLKDFSLDGKVPKVLVYPGNEDEISKVVKLANKEGWSVIPWGGGTKIGLGGIPRQVDIVISLSRLNSVTDLDLGNLTITAQAGITLNEVQKTLASKGRGYFIRLDPPFSKFATLGGIVATNSNGPSRFLYGSLRDMILGIGFIASNGDIIGVGGKTAKNVSGYDVDKLLIGFLGTLGIITGITFKLFPLPEKSATIAVIFSSLENTHDFTSGMLNSNLFPASMEILNVMAMHELSMDIPDNGKYAVAICAEGVEESVNRQLKDIEEMGKNSKALEVRSYLGEDHVHFWDLLSDFPKVVAERYPYGIACKSNFLISKFAEMVKVWEDRTTNNGLSCALISRAGNGLLYSYILIEDNIKKHLDTVVHFLEDMTEEAVQRDGNVVIEFAPVALKERISVWGRLRDDFKIMHGLKKQIDPAGILNPGRFVGGI
ncbi:MAG: FAD-binding oxidoreductase [Thermodesulfobacteriota bacterium]